GLVFTPAAGASGAASVRVAADDGFGSSASGVIDINVSDAPLLAIDFEFRELGFSQPGLEATIAVIGQFADQQDVFLPYSYLDATVGDSSVVALSDAGSLLTLKD